MPMAIQLELDKIIRGFFWGDVGDDLQVKRKLHIISWSKLCLPKHSGGLQITSLRNRNGAMMGKWWWRLNAYIGQLWHTVLRNIYGRELVYDQSTLVSKPSPTLKGILNLKKWPQLGDLIKQDKFIWKIRSGSKVSFWHDKWNSEGLLKERFPRLFTLSIIREATVAEVIKIWNEKGESSPKWWRRTFF